MKRVAFGTLRVSTEYGKKVYQKSIIKNIRSNMGIRVLCYFNLGAPLQINLVVCAQFYCILTTN